MNATQEPKPGEKLSGDFHVFGTSFLTGPNLIHVPEYYNMINVSTGVLEEKANVKFTWFSSRINIPMVKKVQMEKNVMVLFSVGGEESNFDFLNGADKVTNFYNSLAEYYINWGFNGIIFDICRVSQSNLLNIVKTIQWFKESFPEAFISVIAKATDVSPVAGGIYGPWNRLVPLINPLKDIIDLLQIRAYGYGKAFEDLSATLPQGPIHTSPPSTSNMNVIPVGDRKKMLEYIFSSFVSPFVFVNPVESEDSAPVYGYYGFDAAKIMLGVLPAGYLGPEYYVEPEDLKEVMLHIHEANNKIGGIMISSINDDAQNIYDFSRRLTRANSDCLY